MNKNNYLKFYMKNKISNKSNDPPPMKNIEIKQSGRFGNFLMRLKNCIHIALFYNFNVILPKHNFVNTTYIVINKNITLENDKIIDSNNFFYRNKINNIDIKLFNINEDKVKTIIKNILLFPTNLTPLGINDLVIHIRSGDLFIKSVPHPRYLTPPISYYKNIIDQNKNYENIYIIAEDCINPCINKLLEIYPTIKFKIQSLQ